MVEWIGSMEMPLYPSTLFEPISDLVATNSLLALWFVSALFLNHLSAPALFLWASYTLLRRRGDEGNFVCWLFMWKLGVGINSDDDCMVLLFIPRPINTLK